MQNDDDNNQMNNENDIDENNQYDNGEEDQNMEEIDEENYNNNNEEEDENNFANDDDNNNEIFEEEEGDEGNNDNNNMNEYDENNNNDPNEEEEVENNNNDQNEEIQNNYNENNDMNENDGENNNCSNEVNEEDYQNNPNNNNNMNMNDNNENDNDNNENEEDENNNYNPNNEDEEEYNNENNNYDENNQNIPNNDDNNMNNQNQNNLSKENQGNYINNNNNNMNNANKINEESRLNQSNHYSIATYNAPVQRIKPKYYKLLSQIITNNFELILDFLDLIDLSSMRGVNRLFLSIIHEYYQKRLKFEINLIINYQEINKEKTTIFMKNIDSQIPISSNNWLDFDLQSVTQKLKLFDRNLLTKLRSIKSIGKLNDCIYAPFCIILGQNKNNNNKTKRNTWKKTATKILNESNLLLKIADLDFENMSESDILNAFVFLNLNELNLETIKKFSSDFSKLIVWCQAVVSYHILIHPYTFRNTNGVIAYGSDVYKFSEQMNYMINRFYKFKRFLYNLNIVKIPLADYVFNLQHNRDIPQKQESAFKYLTEINLGNILSYLPYVSSYKFMGVSKKFYNGFKCAIDLEILEILKEIYFVKSQAYSKISNIIPIIYSHNIFSSYFLMLDDILHTQVSNEAGLSFIPFLNKEQLSDLKKIKSKNENVIKIAQIFCIICDEKPNKKLNLKGVNEYLWLDKVKTLVINGKLLKNMRNLNQLSFSEQKIKLIDKEITMFYNVKKLEEVKKINHGIYQLLIWELYVYEFLKIYNPFDFIDPDYILNRYEQEELDLIKYYIEILNYLKYHLKIKYHFSTNNGTLNPAFHFGRLVLELKKFLFNNINNCQNDIIFMTTDENLSKVANVYFDSKNLISIGAKPSLYEKLFVEILMCREKELLGIQQMPNYIINNNESNIANVDYTGNNNVNSMNNNNANIQLNNNMINNNQIDYAKEDMNNISPNPYMKNIYLNNVNSRFNKITINNNSELSLMDLPDYLIIKNILFYLDINSLPKFSLVSHKANDCIKIHIFIRLFFLNKEKKLIELENNEIINNILNKRNEFFNDYEIAPPNKKHSLSLMNKITSEDIMEIKQCFRKYNKNYEAIIEPLMILLGEKANSMIKPDGTKVISFYPTAKKVLFKVGFIKRIRDMELETIDSNIFKNVEKIIEKPIFNDDKIKSLSPCLCHLISWINGVVEFHRYIRKYSLSNYDYEILSEEEINFCIEMDNIVLLYYKLLRYASKYCKNYEPYAHQIMEMMNISNVDEEKQQ